VTRTLVGHPEEPGLADMPAERGVPGALLPYPASVPTPAPFLDPAAFTVTGPRVLFLAARPVLAVGARYDPVSVSREPTRGPGGAVATAAPALAHELVGVAPVEQPAPAYVTTLHTLAGLQRTRAACEQPLPEPLYGFPFDEDGR
jgi:hypothetical protein